VKGPDLVVKTLKLQLIRERALPEACFRGDGLLRLEMSSRELAASRPRVGTGGLHTPLNSLEEIYTIAGRANHVTIP